MIILVLIVSFNKVNRSKINTEFKNLTIAGGETIKDFIEVSGYHLIQMGEESLTQFLDRLYGNKSIFYIGLMKSGDLIYLLSRYEGYFPVEETGKDIRFVPSPIGLIFEIKGKFHYKEDNYIIFMGFDYHFLESFERSSGKYFLFVVGVIFAVLLIIAILVLRYDRILYRKDIEYIKEKEEKERLMELSLLTSEIAHEIKNPLNSIYLSFNSIDQYLSDSDENARFYKKAIKGEIKRISEIINSYSDLSRKVEVNNTFIDLVEFIEEFRLLKLPEMEQKGVNFSISSTKNKFITDRDLLIQIILNLVNNAMEADAKNINVELSGEKNKLVITVQDDGRGIDSAKKDKIFKPYVSSKIKGMGLGLHITMKNVKILNGEINLLSGEDGNKIFVVTLKEGKNEKKKI